ncbi:SFT2-like protein [Oesophagostomum dentatum]|uniref:Vesicle transport protein n=1 Tax=Oesophagostomum dentatum TaxID=61180 RepID=A0A0B1STW7_OESDE|nr:SFT2-like protein [Oesophagostomum dentatum]
MSSIGAILSLASTCFLMGPVGQCKKMFDKSRWLASLFYVGFIALALIAGLVLKNAPLALVSIGGQYVAMAWYSLSYIPYAR